MAAAGNSMVTRAGHARSCSSRISFSINLSQLDAAQTKRRSYSKGCKAEDERHDVVRKAVLPG